MSVIYGINSDGILYWYRHEGWQDGSVSWASGGSGVEVGHGWGFETVFASSDGVIYGIKSDGKLYWYQHEGWQGDSVSWANSGSGVEVGHGWGFETVFASSDGVIYGIKSDGKLYWYQHEGWKTGSVSWASGSGAEVGHGWGFETVFASSDGVIYGIKSDGKLYWYQHEGWKTGSVSWASGSGAEVGHGWGFETVFASSDGVIYGIKSDGKLYWYRHEGWKTGSVSWANGGSGVNVGHGWDFKTVFAIHQNSTSTKVPSPIITGKVSFPIKGSRLDNVAGGHMQTDFSLTEGGSLNAVTRWWTNVKLTGFTGSVTVVLTDSNGISLWASKPQTHGVDGEWVGDDDRHENWSEIVPPEIAKQVGGYAIIQQHDPHWRIFDKGEKLLTWLRSEEGQETVKAVGTIVAVAAAA